MSRLADISSLVGRRFVSGSMNECRLQRIGPGGIRAKWKRKPLDADRSELETFIAGILGPINTTYLMDPKGEAEAEAYRRWVAAEGETRRRPIRYHSRRHSGE